MNAVLVELSLRISDVYEGRGDVLSALVRGKGSTDHEDMVPPDEILLMYHQRSFVISPW